ncbi:lipid kinase [Planktothrix sp. FACHB-1365]|uniref:lipid kinase n=1 Tax=Planktothrix sp. FACHB-1365 TaxID=2692855 RepID=UPI0016865391|nr:lipid kinase [Planktothrix sp. FACHB-1365]MBD2481752.1 lipid kinase [Planktothrix sp. FACHB-1365]
MANFPQPAHPKTALLLINPHARKTQKNLSQVVYQLQALDFDIIQESPEHPQEFTSTIQRYKDQVDFVIVGGGDGTLNAAVDGLVETGLPLAIVPLGTANDLARTLGIPASVTEACQIIACGHQQKIDLGWVNGKHFFNVASLGLSVKITRKLTKKSKKHWGALAYVWAAIQATLTARPFRALIEVDSQIQRVKTLQIAVGNGKYYGGGMSIVHDATIDDQRLDLYSLEIKHWWQIPWVWLTLRTGRHREELGVRTLSGSDFQIYTSKPYPINTDGEITTWTPAHFRVIPQALTVLVPQPK